MTDSNDKLTDAANSHLHKANGWEIEHISFRIVGRVLVRFKGHNSRRDRGLGMTILEKLERQGLIPNE